MARWFRLTCALAKLPTGVEQENFSCNQTLDQSNAYGVVVGVSGFMEPEEYDSKHEEGCFGTPSGDMDGNGYNW